MSTCSPPQGRPRQCAPGQAARAVLRRYVAMLYEAWAVSATYNGVTKPAMSAAFPFPLCLYLPALLRWRNMQRCERCGINTPQRAERAARSCLAALEARLASTAPAGSGSAVASEYFFGSEPSALDATVYAYIETIYRSPYNGCVSTDALAHTLLALQAVARSRLAQPRSASVQPSTAEHLHHHPCLLRVPDLGRGAWCSGRWRLRASRET